MALIVLSRACREFPGCGNIVTFSQFLFIAVEGFIFEADFGRKRPAIPIRYDPNVCPNWNFAWISLSSKKASQKSTFPVG